MWRARSIELRQKGLYCLNNMRIWKRSFCLIMKGKVKSKVELGCKNKTTAKV